MVFPKIHEIVQFFLILLISIKSSKDFGSFKANVIISIHRIYNIMHMSFYILW